MWIPMRNQNYSNINFRKHDFYLEKIILGSSLEAVLYARLHSLPIIFNNEDHPPHFEFLEPAMASRICDSHDTFNFVSNKGDLIFGPQKLDLWRQICFDLSMQGLVPFGFQTDSVRIADNILKVFGKNCMPATVHFDEICFFSDKNVHGIQNELTYRAKDNYKIMDWAFIKSGSKHEYDVYYTDDDFVKEVYFYPSDRIAALNLGIKDLVSISYLNFDQIQDFKYSYTMARFKILKQMTDLGIKGKKYGFANGKQRYMPLEVEMQERQLIMMEKNLYDDIENVKFLNLTLEDILNGRD